MEEEGPASTGQVGFPESRETPTCRGKGGSSPGRREKLSCGGLRQPPGAGPRLVVSGDEGAGLIYHPPAPAITSH